VNHDWKTLVRNAVRNAMPRQTAIPVLRWACVRDTLAVGSTLAKTLCEEFGVDPDEMIFGFICDRCPALEDDE